MEKTKKGKKVEIVLMDTQIVKDIIETKRAVLKELAYR